MNSYPCSHCFVQIIFDVGRADAAKPMVTSKLRLVGEKWMGTAILNSHFSVLPVMRHIGRRCSAQLHSCIQREGKIFKCCVCHVSLAIKATCGWF